MVHGGGVGQLDKCIPLFGPSEWCPKKTPAWACPPTNPDSGNRRDAANPHPGGIDNLVLRVLSGHRGEATSRRVRSRLHRGRHTGTYAPPQRRDTTPLREHLDHVSGGRRRRVPPHPTGMTQTESGPRLPTIFENRPNRHGPDQPQRKLMPITLNTLHTPTLHAGSTNGPAGRTVRERT